MNKAKRGNKTMTLVAFGIVALFIVGAFNPMILEKFAKADEVKQGKQGISPEDAHALEKTNAAISFIDVRSFGEYSLGHIKNAISMPLPALGCGSCLQQKLAKDKDALLIVYDTDGSASMQAYDILVSNGFSSVKYLVGGLNAWKHAGYQVSASVQGVPYTKPNNPVNGISSDNSTFYDQNGADNQLLPKDMLPNSSSSSDISVKKSDMLRNIGDDMMGLIYDSAFPIKICSSWNTGFNAWCVFDNFDECPPDRQECTAPAGQEVPPSIDGFSVSGSIPLNINVESSCNAPGCDGYVGISREGSTSGSTSVSYLLTGNQNEIEITVEQSSSFFGSGSASSSWDDTYPPQCAIGSVHTGIQTFDNLFNFFIPINVTHPGYLYVEDFELSREASSQSASSTYGYTELGSSDSCVGGLYYDASNAANCNIPWFGGSMMGFVNDESGVQHADLGADNFFIIEPSSSSLPSNTRYIGVSLSTGFGGEVLVGSGVAQDGTQSASFSFSSHAVLRLKLKYYPFDLDADSDNTNNEPDYGPERTYYEDQIECDGVHPGKYININDDHDNGNPSVPDYNVFNNAKEDDFVRIVLQIPDHVDLDTPYMEFSYDSYVLRVWKKDGNQPRDPISDVLPPNEMFHPYTPRQLGFSEGQTTINLWVEALHSLQDYWWLTGEITVSIFPHEHNGADFGCYDTVTVFPIPNHKVDLAIDSNNNGIIEPNDDPIETIPPGKYILLNNDDDNNNNQPDMNEANPTNGEDELVNILLADHTDPSNWDHVQWKLTYTSNVKIWRTKNRDNLMPNDTPQSYPIPEELWVEGITLSTKPGDVSIALKVVDIATQDVIAADRVNATVALRNWTILVYMDGDNDLESHIIDDFLEMAQVGSTHNVSIMVQLDRHPNYDTRYGDWSGAVRFNISKGMEPCLDKAVANLGVTDMGDPLTLRDFIKWGIRKSPASRYILILGGPGDSWRGLAPDWTSGDYMTPKDVNWAIQSAKVQLQLPGGFKLDIVGFDAPYTASAEIAYELKDTAKYMIASEDIIAADGWPYSGIVTAIDKTPCVDNERTARDIIDEFRAYYTPKNEYCTVSALNLSKIYDFVTVLQSFATEFQNTFINGNNKAKYRLQLAFVSSLQGAFTSDPSKIDIWYFSSNAPQQFSGWTDLTNIAWWIQNHILLDLVIDTYVKDAGGLSSHLNGINVYLPSSTIWSYEKTQYYNAASFSNIWGANLLDYTAPVHSVYYRWMNPGATSAEWRGTLVKGGWKLYETPPKMYEFMRTNSRTIPWVTGQAANPTGADTYPPASANPSDHHLVTLNHVRTTLTYGGIPRTTFSDDEGYFMFPSDPRITLNGDSGVIDVSLQDGAANTVRVIDYSSGNANNVVSHVFPNFVINTRTDFSQQLDFWGVGGHDRDFAVIYHHTMQALEFTRQILVFTLDHALPVDVLAYAPLVRWDQTTSTWVNDNTCFYTQTGGVFDLLLGGVHQTRTVNPSTIVFSDDGSPFSDRNRPDNREWHEFAHHIMTDSLIGGENQLPINGPGDYNHNGYQNSNSADSWVEGFAEFTSLAISDSITQDPHSEVYDGFGSLEDNYLVNIPPHEGNHNREEFAVAGVLWDLYDGFNGADHDNVQLFIDQIWDIVNKASCNTLYDIYLQSNAAVGSSDLDQIFIAHNCFDDANRNGVYNGGETIGLTSWEWPPGSGQYKSHRPNTPPVPGSGLLLTVFDSGTNGLIGTYELTVELRYASPYEFENRDYTIFVDGDSYVEFYMPPPNYDAVATITVKKDGYFESEPITMDTAYYWGHLGGDCLLSHTFYLIPLAGTNAPMQPTDATIWHIVANDMNKGICGRDISYTYTTTSTQTSGNIYYTFFWGDGTSTEVGPYASGVVASATHCWALGALGDNNVYATARIGSQTSTSSPTLVVKMFKLADCNWNGVVDNFDISPFVKALTGGKTGYYAAYPAGYYYTADCSMNQVVDNFDIQFFTKLLVGDGGNRPPSIPNQPSGPINGITGKTYSYNTTATDPDGDRLYYQWDWGDGSVSGWLGPYPSGQTVTETHGWAADGTYQIKVKVKDVYGKESTWSVSLQVRIVLLGDMDLNGAVDNFDIGPFVRALTNPVAYQAEYNFDPVVVGDINQDGVLDNFDIGPFVDLITHR